MKQNDAKWNQNDQQILVETLMTKREKFFTRYLTTLKERSCQQDLKWQFTAMFSLLVPVARFNELILQFWVMYSTTVIHRTPTAKIKIFGKELKVMGDAELFFDLIKETAKLIMRKIF